MPREPVHVIGAGVTGLTTALVLLERGFAVRVLARERSPRTTSDVAGAFWHPYKVEVSERALGWAAVAWRRFAEAAADPASGVELLEGIELLARPEPDPWWRPAVAASFSRLEPQELPPGRADGWRFLAPVIEPPRFLAWLACQLASRGGVLESRAVASLEEAARGARALVVCAGLGARELAGDRDLFPSRGQIAHLEPVALGR